GRRELRPALDEGYGRLRLQQSELLQALHVADQRVTHEQREVLTHGRSPQRREAARRIGVLAEDPEVSLRQHQRLELDVSAQRVAGTVIVLLFADLADRRVVPGPLDLQPDHPFAERHADAAAALIAGLTREDS